MSRDNHRNPTRRNRNIGTAKSGHGQNNRFKIPRGWHDDRMFWEKLVDPVILPVQVQEQPITFYIEPPLTGFRHALTVEDVVRVLSLVPASDLEGLKNVVLRQPKRKERIFSTVWGRLVYWANLGANPGPSIYLEAQEQGKPIKWPKSLKPDDVLELERLQKQGHYVVTDRRHHMIHSSDAAIRTTQLFHTLPHELGHLVDFVLSVQEPSGGDTDEYERLSNLYRNCPLAQKEVFAHRYSEEFQASNHTKIPFASKWDEDAMQSMGISPSWFIRHEAAQVSFDD